MTIPAVVFVISSMLPKTYESRATIAVQATANPSTLISGQIRPSASLAQAQTLIKTTLVGRRAAEAMDLPPSAARGLVGHVSAAPTNPGDTKGEFLTITARASSPVEAARIANAFANAIAKTRSASAIRQIERTIALLTSQKITDGEGSEESAREALATQLQQLRLLKAGQKGTTPIVEPAVPQPTPVAPKPRRNTTIALILALLIAALLAPLLDRLDRRVREPGELEELLEAPVLAMIPDDAFPGHPPGLHVRESFQTLRASLTYFNVDRSLSTLVVASPIQQDGKTTVAVNLALAYALDERDVVLVDGDLRRPQVAARLGKDVEFGLDSVLVGERTLEETLVNVDAGAGRLRILPGAAPPPNPAVMLGSQRMRSLLAELSEKVDMVVIDTPGLLAVSDAIPLFNQVAGTVIVSRLNKTPRDALSRAKRVINSAGGTVLGSVVTGANAGGIYGYYGYYGYYGAQNDRDSAESGKGGRLRSLARRGGSDDS